MPTDDLEDEINKSNAIIDDLFLQWARAVEDVNALYNKQITDHQAANEQLQVALHTRLAGVLDRYAALERTYDEQQEALVQSARYEKERIDAYEAHEWSEKQELQALQSTLKTHH